MRSASLMAFALVSVQTVSWAQSFDQGQVSQADKDQWCNDQTTACPLICSQLPGESTETRSNSCDPSSLIFSCICHNGQSPNASQYSQTIPYHICTETNTQCQTNCGGDSACASSCVQNHPCGAQNPKRVKTSSKSAAAASTSGGKAASTAIYTGYASGAQPSSTKAAGSGAAARAAVDLGQSYGLAVVIVGLLAGFGLVL